MYHADRDERAVRAVLQKVSTESASKGDLSKPMPTDRSYQWIVDEIILNVYPKPDAGEQQDITLTWRMLLDTLRGVQTFMDKFPGLFCGWDVLQRPENIQVGSGSITTFL